MYPSGGCSDGDLKMVLEDDLVRGYGKMSTSLDHREGGVLRVIPQQ